MLDFGGEEKYSAHFYQAFGRNIEATQNPSTDYSPSWLFPISAGCYLSFGRQLRLEQ